MTDKNARSVYADIIDLPHHQSAARKHMSLYDRAAQFASYKALSGYEDMVAEESRITDGEIELSENEIDLINAVIGEISDRIANGEHPTVSVTYFKPDRHKQGGSYETLTGIIKKVDIINKKLIFYGSESIEDKRIPTVDISISKTINIMF
ncbi:MAG: hypothetical protein IJG87_06135 [Ruminococcus sp.]|nr:hypothetical protein [Ruminococcus sp.]